MENLEQPQSPRHSVVEVAKHVAYVLSGPHLLAPTGEHTFPANHPENVQDSPSAA